MRARTKRKLENTAYVCIYVCACEGCEKNDGGHEPRQSTRKSPIYPSAIKPSPFRSVPFRGVSKISLVISREVEKLRFVIFTMAHLFQNSWQVTVARVVEGLSGQVPRAVKKIEHLAARRNLHYPLLPDRSASSSPIYLCLRSSSRTDVRETRRSRVNM